MYSHNVLVTKYITSSIFRNELLGFLPLGFNFWQYHDGYRIIRCLPRLMDSTARIKEKLLLLFLFLSFVTDNYSTIYLY